MLTGLLFGQDVLTHKSGKIYKGKYYGIVEENIVFYVEGGTSNKMFPIGEVTSIETSNGMLSYPFGTKPLSIEEKAIYDANLYDLKHWVLYGPISTIIFWGCTHLYLEDGEKLWDNLNSLRGSSAASLTIPYFVLNWKEKFTYPKSLTDDDDRLYYKKVYSIRLTGRKIKWIVGSTIVTGAVVVGIYFATVSVDGLFSSGGQ